MLTTMYYRNNPMKCGCFPKVITEIFLFMISSFQSGITNIHMYPEDNGDVNRLRVGQGKRRQFRLIITGSH